jgi:NADH-quinone oxidoreductase subunit M
MTLSAIIFLPLVVGLLAAFAPRSQVRWIAVAGSVAVLVYSIVLLAGYPSHGSGLKWAVDDMWIRELGIHYSIGIDGLNLFLVVLTALLWVPATIAAALREWESPRVFFFNMALAQTAVLGAFCAQDVALFVFFFDLMLVPFYFLIGAFGGRRRVAATTKFVIYTLVGSLLMLAAAVALGVLSKAGAGGHISFNIADLAQHPLSKGSQEWIFLLFAAAFLVKMPAFPLHGWMPDAYRATPIPVLVLLSAVLSKVGAYGFLRIVLPLMPDASRHFQELMIVIAVVSILYGSVLAFSQDNGRLVIGYSSIAQLGFITLGIFSLDPKGAQGAVFQMVNHGVVTAVLFLVVGLLAARAGGSDLLSRMGGLAMRAPVLAALFLIAAFAALAMPGSGNFVGELYILFGIFSSKLAYGIVASVGVALAAVYMIRMYQRAMHNRLSAGAESRELSRADFGLIAPLIAVIVFLGVYPQFVLSRSELSTTSRVPSAQNTIAIDGRVVFRGQVRSEWRTVPSGAGSP